MTFLNGYKTYFVAFAALLWAGIGYWSGILDLKTVTELVSVGLAAAGLRSGMNSTLTLLLQAWGIQLPPSPSMKQVKAAVAAAGDVARKSAPLVLACILTLSIGLSGCGSIFKTDPKSILQDVEYGASLAEAAYESICLTGNAPSFCTDPQAKADYEKAKETLDRAINTAAAAIDISGDVNSQTIAALLATLQADWQSYNAIVNSVKLKDASRRGIAFKAIPLK